MHTIDLRSDTVTKPGPAMREAMANAEVGDDVYGEDPTVTKLEKLAAYRLGKETAVFVPSGTMANQIAVYCATSPGDQLLIGEHAHILRYESGAASALWGVQLTTLGRDGFFTGRDVARAIPHRDVHNTPATALSIENTHNVSGGRVWPRDQLDEVTSTARDRGLHVHLDGARIFNAACAAGVSAAELAARADTVAFCLSKGLGAPVGSLLCGPHDLRAAMLRGRKMLGGGMRQAGILAAAGVLALERHVDRLANDHAHAARLARGLDDLGLETTAPPETNIVVFRIPKNRSRAVADAPGFSKRAREVSLLINPIDGQHLRAVTHLDVSAEDIADALERIKSLL
jgi:threonine aldolase